MDEDDVATATAGAGNEAAACGVGVARFHAITFGHATEEVVGGFEVDDASVVESEGVVATADGVANGGVAVGDGGDASDVACGGVLAWGGEAVSVGEVGVGSAESAGAGVHFLGESLGAASVVACEGVGEVVATAHKEGGEELAASVNFAGADAGFGGFNRAVDALHAHLFVEVAGFYDDEGGEEFLRAGGDAGFVGVACGDDGAVVGIDEDVGFGADGGGIGRDE